MAEVREGLALRSPIIRKKLCEKDDFYVEIDWKFTSWIPFVSRFCPCDTFKIWKRGSDFRLDMTLIDFESFSWKRGHISFIFKMNKETDKAEFHVVNHTEKTRQLTNKQKELDESKNDLEIDENLETLLQSEVVSPEIITNKIVISKSKSWMGYEKSLEINNKKCTLYELKNLIVLANKRDSHVPQQVKQERALAKQLLNQKIEASKKGEVVDFDTIESIEQEQNEQNTQNSKDLQDNNVNNTNDEQTETKQNDNNSNKNKNNNNNNDDNKMTEPIEKKTNSISAIKNSIFGEIKQYDYPEYIPPKIRIEEYFDVNKWQKRKMEKVSTKMKRKKKKATAQIMQERKDTFKINPAPCTTTTKSFKLNLAMTEHFGLSIEEILAILEAAAPQSKLAAKLKEFLEIKMPRGFPIQLELPLFHVLKATVTFQNFEHINPSDDIFVVPQEYLLVEKDKGKDKNKL